METWELFANHHRLEKSLRTSNPLTSYGYCLSIGKLVNFIILAGIVIRFELLSEVLSYVAMFFFDVSDDF